MKCWKCTQDLQDLKITFRATCPACGVDLHVCAACRYYALGKPNDCLVPGTDYVRDREASNLCEDFKPREETPPPNSNPSTFNSLFKD